MRHAVNEVEPEFIQKITSSKVSKTSRSRSFQFSPASGSPSNRRGRLQKAETISEDRLERERHAAAGMEEKIASALETRVNLLKEDTAGSQPSSDDERAPAPAPTAPAQTTNHPQQPAQLPTIQVSHVLSMCCTLLVLNVFTFCVVLYSGVPTGVVTPCVDSGWVFSFGFALVELQKLFLWLDLFMILATIWFGVKFRNDSRGNGVVCHFFH